MSKSITTQDLFLKQVKNENVYVTINLSNASHLKGMVKGFDNFVIMLELNDRKQILVYKHAIISIIPSKYVNIKDSSS